MGIDAQMFLRVPYKPDAAQIKQWSYAICESLGAQHFFIDREGKYGELPRGAMSLIDVYEQDGPKIVPETGETFIELHLWDRWYGKDYERGDLLTLCAIAEWCEQNVPDCQVWYGGDSSGVEAVPFPEEARRDLRQHLYSQDGRAYYASDFIPSQDGITPDTSNCALCITGKKPIRHGWGKDYAKFSCHGCGQKFVTRDGGKTWSDKDVNEA